MNDVLQMKLQKRRLAICLASTHTEPNMYQAEIHKLLPCKVIYSKEYKNGTLFALLFSKKTSVGHMDRKILHLEQSLHRNSGSDNFTSISDVLSGKIKSFGVGEHLTDKHFKALFTSDVHYCRDPMIHSDVKAWYPEVRIASLTDDDSES